MSADGRTILLDEIGQGGGARQGVYLRGTDGSPAIRLGDGTGEGLSPDGKWAISVTVDRSHIVLLPTGPGESRTLDRGPLDRIQRAFWFPDGQRILIAGHERGHAARFYVETLADGSLRPISPEGITVDATISPDGRQWRRASAASSHCSRWPAARHARSRVCVRPNWSSAGRRTQPDSMSTIPVRLPLVIVRVDLATGRRQEVKEIRAANASPIFGVLYLFATPDLRAYAYATRHQDSELFLGERLK
jgi:hypothetical protein